MFIPSATAGRESQASPSLPLGLSFTVCRTTRLVLQAPHSISTTESTPTTRKGEEGGGDRSMAIGLDKSTGLQENEQGKNEASSTSTQGPVPIYPVSQIVVLKLEE